MSAGVEIDVDEKRLTGLSSELSGVYRQLSNIKNELEHLHTGIRANWSDAAVEEFTQKYDEGMEGIWDLLVAVDSIEGFFQDAAEGYISADNQVMSL